jgi:hypothetical protein
VHKENIVELLKEEESGAGLVRYFVWNNREYSVVNRPCYIDDAKTILRAILQQAINDFIKLSSKKLTKDEDKFDLQTAKGFIFDDDYVVDFGGMDLNIRDLLFYLQGSEPNMDIFRASVMERLHDYQKKR